MGFGGDVSEPFASFIILNTSFGNKDRHTILLIVFNEDIVERAISMVAERYLSAVGPVPLIMEIVIQSDHIEVQTAASQIRIGFAKHHVECVKLRTAKVFGLAFCGRGLPV